MSKRKKKKEGFWQQYFRRYDVVFTQRGGHDVEHRVSTSRFIVSLYILALVIAVAAITAVLLFYSPLKTLMPGYVNPMMRKQIVESSLRIDSLNEAVMRHQQYVTNIQSILRGDLKVDSINTLDSLTVLRSADLVERTERETEFVLRYENEEKYNLTAPVQKNEMDKLHFSPPLRGMVVNPFAPSRLNFGVDVASTNEHNVNAVLDGTILMSGYTANNGYVVIIQHAGNLVTVYKHLDSILKRESTKIKAGEAVGTIGTKDKAQGDPFLHFELWHKGTALDPAQYISF
ncbi:MAG: M23 family metallopeptidase [Bacteroidaceae bacterium]|nr:M23 family metallopeptidase [Bacteroidaceae bacterium]